MPTKSKEVIAILERNVKKGIISFENNTARCSQSIKAITLLSFIFAEVSMKNYLHMCMFCCQRISINDCLIFQDVMRVLKSYLKFDDAFQYAQYVLRWEQIPADKRAHLMREKQ
ncbi:hypothetical protein U1Q18_022579, partial [Sarracenia purpurea var. burkii]